MIQGRSVFHNLDLRVARHYCRHVLLVARIDPETQAGRDAQGWESPGAGITGESLWVPTATASS